MVDNNNEKMDWKTKTIATGIIVLFLFMLGFILKTQYDLQQKLVYIEKNVIDTKDLGNGLIRSQATYVTKEDLEKIIKQNGINISDLKNDIDKLGMDLKAINVAIAKTPGYKGDNIPSTYVTITNIDPQQQQPGNAGNNTSSTIEDPFGYVKNTQWLVLSEPLGNGLYAPVGRTGFSASKEKPWTVEILPRSYEAVTVLAEDEEGRHSAYSKVTIKVDGKDYVLPVTSKLSEQVPSSSFSWNPRLYLSTDFGTGNLKAPGIEVVPNLSVSLFSYGRTKIKPDFSFLNIGIGFGAMSKNATFMLEPISYNVGKHLPLMTNLHIGPSISIDTSGNVGLFLGIRVGL